MFKQIWINKVLINFKYQHQVISISKVNTKSCLWNKFKPHLCQSVSLYILLPALYSSDKTLNKQIQLGLLNSLLIAAQSIIHRSSSVVTKTSNPLNRMDALTSQQLAYIIIWKWHWPQLLLKGETVINWLATVVGQENTAFTSST